MIGKWHLGEGKAHEPTGFDHWDILPGQGVYFDPEFITPGGGLKTEIGYATDLITDKTLAWLEKRDQDRPFFVMCHHKAPHSPWQYHPRHADLYKDKIKIPATFNDTYENRAAAAAAAKIRIRLDMSYLHLDLVQPPGPMAETGALRNMGPGGAGLVGDKDVPFPDDPTTMRPLIDVFTGDKYTFKTQQELAEWKYQRYMQKYLRTLQ